MKLPLDLECGPRVPGDEEEASAKRLERARRHERRWRTSRVGRRARGEKAPEMDVSYDSLITLIRAGQASVRARVSFKKEMPMHLSTVLVMMYVSLY